MSEDAGRASAELPGAHPVLESFREPLLPWAPSRSLVARALGAIVLLLYFFPWTERQCSPTCGTLMWTSGFTLATAIAGRVGELFGAGADSFWTLDALEARGAVLVLAGPAIAALALALLPRPHHGKLAFLAAVAGTGCMASVLLYFQFAFAYFDPAYCELTDLVAFAPAALAAGGAVLVWRKPDWEARAVIPAAATGVLPALFAVAHRPLPFPSAAFGARAAALALAAAVVVEWRALEARRSAVESPREP